MIVHKRWIYVAYGLLGHVWHDTAYNRYVISDEYGPSAQMGEKGVRGGGKRGPHRDERWEGNSKGKVDAL